ncbi:MAG: hypothetical protein HN413_13235 [Chloroflexi bacterium]|jgi:hypothetical protein|nr:hypothetical protein [Chloroflexota bacterium]
MTPQDMSYCQLVGWLEICAVRNQPSDKKSQVTVIEGFINTDKAYFGGRHPVIIKGKPTEVILAAANGHQTKRLRLFAHGSLRSTDECTRVNVKFVRIIKHDVDVDQLTKEIAQLIEQSPNGNAQEAIADILERHIGNTWKGL